MSTAFQLRRTKKGNYLELKSWQRNWPVITAFSIKPSNLRNGKQRRIFADIHGFTAKNFSEPCQVHDRKIYAVKKPGKIYSATDGLITREPGIPLSIVTADCLAVYIFDKATPAIGLIHAGWRGTFEKIVCSAIKKMGREFNTKPEHCLAAISPGICWDCYDVGSDIAHKFSRRFKQPLKWLKKNKNNKFCLNLKELNKIMLVESGIKPDNIISSGFCTRCDSAMFFSYRGEGKDTGRCMALVELKKTV